jgi:hypothetical protein
MTNIYIRTLLKKINSRAVAMLIAVILAVSGIVMIFNQITDQGMIDIKSPVLSGKLTSGFVGMFLIFFSVLISAITLKTSICTNQEVTIKNGKNEISYKNIPFDKVLEFNELIKGMNGISENDDSGVKNKPNQHMDFTGKTPDDSAKV